ncbi:MAG: hypothetical protein KGL39_06405 [Patescibacteria group bacterium]|nr:hypothetical protein [Patescibacteria group bacterium]
MDPASYLEISVPDALSSTGYSSYRATPVQIGNAATDFVPTTTRVDTIAAEGLTGGGALSSSLTLRFSAVGMPASSAMVPADQFVINNSVTNKPNQVTFSDAMKALTGLPSLAVVNMSNDYLIINHAADGLTYKTNPSALGLPAGLLPAGGTTDQALIKNSATDFDVGWATLAAPSPRTVTAAGTIMLLGTDVFVYLNKSDAAEIDLPDAATWATDWGLSGLDLCIYDISGAASINNQTIKPSGTDNINGGVGGVVIDTDYGSYVFRPISGGWVAR